MSDEKVFLNLGCGNRYHPEWINIDLNPSAPEVIQHDLSRGIPLPDATCDVVYHAAVLEHIRRSDAELFLAECFRVLKPGGIIRVGVPDLEKICQLYLSKLTAVLNGDQEAAYDYEWIMIELYDQTVREKTGGRMVDYLRQNPLLNESFIYERIGEEGHQLVRSLRNSRPSNRRSRLGLLRRLQRRLYSLPHRLKCRIAELLLGREDRKALMIGRFRLSGEIHQYMYDRYSLGQMLCQVGFCNPQVKDAYASTIPNWTSFHLDTLPNGQVIKPDLFFTEAIKPGFVIYE